MLFLCLLINSRKPKVSTNIPTLCATRGAVLKSKDQNVMDHNESGCQWICVCVHVCVVGLAACYNAVYFSSLPPPNFLHPFPSFHLLSASLTSWCCPGTVLTIPFVAKKIPDQHCLTYGQMPKSIVLISGVLLQNTATLYLIRSRSPQL